jgi:hypothetical protein
LYNYSETERALFLSLVLLCPKVKKGEEKRIERWERNGCEGGKGLDLLAVVLHRRLRGRTESNRNYSQSLCTEG